MGNDNEVRLIDANALKESLKKLKAEGYNQKYVQGLQDAIDGYFPQIIDDAPTIEAITREQYHDMTERFFGEFVDNGADAVTVAKCMFIGLAFGKLELMLFGGNEDGDTCN